jgi:hypothetical protein
VVYSYSLFARQGVLSNRFIISKSYRLILVSSPREFIGTGCPQVNPCLNFMLIIPNGFKTLKDRRKSFKVSTSVSISNFNQLYFVIGFSFEH